MHFPHQKHLQGSRAPKGNSSEQLIKTLVTFDYNGWLLRILSSWLPKKISNWLGGPNWSLLIWADPRSGFYGENAQVDPNHGNLRGPPQCHLTPPPRNSRPWSLNNPLIIRPAISLGFFTWVVLVPLDSHDPSNPIHQPTFFSSPATCRRNQWWPLVLQETKKVILLVEEMRLTTWDVWKNPVNNGINYQAQLVSRISEPSTVAVGWCRKKLIKWKMWVSFGEYPKVCTTTYLLYIGCSNENI